MNYRHYKKTISGKSSRDTSSQPTSSVQVPQSSSSIGFHGRAITPEKRGTPQDMKKSAHEHNKTAATSAERKLLLRNLSIASMKTQLQSQVRNALLTSKANNSRNANATSAGTVTTSSGVLSSLKGSMKGENEREKKLTEKVRALKSENKKLVTLLKESERILSEKLRESKQETERLSQLFTQLWPLLQSQLSADPALASLAKTKSVHKSPDVHKRLMESLAAAMSTCSDATVASETEHKLRNTVERLRADLSNSNRREEELRRSVRMLERRDEELRKELQKALRKARELEGFRCTATDYIMGKTATNEEVLFLMRAHEKIRGMNSNLQDESSESISIPAIIGRQAQLDVLEEIEPSPSFLKTLTNELIMLEPEDEGPREDLMTSATELLRRLSREVVETEEANAEDETSFGD